MVDIKWQVYYYMHIWLLDLKALAQSKFYPILSKNHFFLSKNLKRHPWTHQCLKSPMFTHQVLIYEIGMTRSSVDNLIWSLVFVHYRGHG